MIENLSFDPRFPEEFCILTFGEIPKIQFESYCRANFYQQIWITEGTAVFEIDMKTVTLKKDHYICIGKDMVYRFDNTSTYSGYIVNFTEFYFDRSEQDRMFLQNARIFKEHPQPMPLSNMSLSSDSLGLEYGLKLYADRSNPLWDDIMHTLLKLYLYRSETTLTQSGASSFVLDPNKKLVNDFKQLVNDHFIEHKDLAFYTEQLGISSRQLLYATKQALGKNAKEVIIEKVIIEGKRFLTYSGLSVKQVAYCLGFNEPNNFSIFFHKYTGLTPLAFKKNVEDSSKSKSLT